MFAAAEFADESAYYKGQLGKMVGTARGDARRRATGRPGLRSTTSRNPATPRRIGFMPVEGGGIHRIWYIGGRWAYVSALLDGFTDYIFMTVDMADPAKPREAGRYWIPGMNLAGRRDAELAGRAAATDCTMPIVHGDTAYCRLARRRHGGDRRRRPRATRSSIVHRNWSPPFGGGTHNCLPLPDRDLLVVLDEAVLDHQEDGLKLIWVFDNRDADQPGQHLDLPDAGGGRLRRARAAISARTISTRTGRAAS